MQATRACPSPRFSCRSWLRLEVLPRPHKLPNPPAQRGLRELLAFVGVLQCLAEQPQVQVRCRTVAVADVQLRVRQVGLPGLGKQRAIGCGSSVMFPRFDLRRRLGIEVL